MRLLFSLYLSISFYLYLSSCLDSPVFSQIYYAILVLIDMLFVYNKYYLMESLLILPSTSFTHFLRIPQSICFFVLPTLSIAFHFLPLRRHLLNFTCLSVYFRINLFFLTFFLFHGALLTFCDLFRFSWLFPIFFSSHFCLGICQILFFFAIFF